MNQNTENQETKTKSCPCFFKKFKEWKTILKIIFILGIVLLIIDFSILLHYMNIHAIQKAIAQLKSSNVDTLIGLGANGNEFYPNGLALMWNQGTSFTMISNWMLAIAMIVYPLHAQRQKSQFFYFFAVVNITITFVIYWTLIFFVSLKNGVWNNPSAAVPSFILHAINPFAGFITLGFARKQIKLTKTQLWLTNVAVLLYFFMAMVMFFIGKPLLGLKNAGSKDEYAKYNIVVYTFLNFDKPLFYKGGKIAVVILLDLAMFALGAFLAPAFAWMWKGIFHIQLIKRNECEANICAKEQFINKKE